MSNEKSAFGSAGNDTVAFYLVVARQIDGIIDLLSTTKFSDHQLLIAEGKNICKVLRTALILCFNPQIQTIYDFSASLLFELEDGCLLTTASNEEKRLEYLSAFRRLKIMIGRLVQS